jgi:hypothetical protein
MTLNLYADCGVGGEAQSCLEMPMLPVVGLVGLQAAALPRSTRISPASIRVCHVCSLANAIIFVDQGRDFTSPRCSLFLQAEQLEPAIALDHHENRKEDSNSAACA